MTAALMARPEVFAPTFHEIERVNVLPITADLKNEVMFYQSSTSFVRENGGPVAQQFLDRMPPRFEDAVLDIRVHRLQSGYYPAIPGYHLDWIPRIDKGRPTERPDMSNIPEYEHIVLIVAETSLTEFVAESVSFPDIDSSLNPFGHANQSIKVSGVRTEHVESGSMVLFTSRDWHRPSPALGSEWRLLIRASRASHARIKNEIRTQAQVYIPTLEASW